jgi:probable rRNA maturation factor
VSNDDTQLGDAGELGESGALGEIALTFSYEPDGLTDDLFAISEETLFTAFEFTLEAVDVEQSVEVSVLITTDEGIQELNRDYRGKDEPTDVLSFPLLDEPLVEAPEDQLWHSNEPFGADTEISDAALSEADATDNGAEAADQLIDDEEVGEALFDEDEEIGEWPLHLGDVAIARETVIRQAEKAEHSAAYEVAFLFVHGVLHLVGYDDQTDAGYRAMVAIQEAVLARAGIAP